MVWALHSERSGLRCLFSKSSLYFLWLCFNLRYPSRVTGLLWEVGGKNRMKGRGAPPLVLSPPFLHPILQTPG